MEIQDLEASLSSLGTRELLRQYAVTLALLEERKVVRSKNAPAGDLAETLVRDAYGGELAPKSQKSWDVLLPDGATLQVKCRVLHERRSGHVYSPFRGWEFSRCVFVLFDGRDYSLARAVDVPMESFRERATYSQHVRGWVLGVSVDLLSLPGAADVTAEIAAALEAL